MLKINIVGSINDEEQLSYIETIAKIFVIERRINDLTYDLRLKKILSKSSLIPKGKTDNQKNSYTASLSLLNVRGFI